jgi:hypothetical protein
LLGHRRKRHKGGRQADAERPSRGRSTGSRAS